MSESRTFRHLNGQWVQTENPSNEEWRSMSEPQAKMFTPDRQLRMVVEMRELYRKDQSKPKSQPPSPEESHSILSLGAKG
jgi:hypothetical protein